MNRFDKKWNTVEGNILLRNKPDPGAALAQFIVLGILSAFLIPLFLYLLNENFYDVGEFLLLLLVFSPLFWIVIVLIIEIYWGFLGSEILYYSDKALYIQQKQSFRKDVVISWDCITDIEPYDEPILFYALPTHDPTICLHYKSKNGKSKKVRFGYHLSPKKREIVIERLQELLVKNFG